MHNARIVRELLEQSHWLSVRQTGGASLQQRRPLVDLSCVLLSGEVSSSRDEDCTTAAGARTKRTLAHLDGYTASGDEYLIAHWQEIVALAHRL